MWRERRGQARGSSICALPAMPRTSEALPPVYRQAELEMNFASSAEAGGDGTDDAHLTTGPSPSSPSARTDPSQRADEPEPGEVVELEMSLLGGSEAPQFVPGMMGGPQQGMMQAQQGMMQAPGVMDMQRVVASRQCVIVSLLSVSWLPRRALPYSAFVALIADLLSRACDGCGVDEQHVRDAIAVAELVLAATPCDAV